MPKLIWLGEDHLHGDGEMPPAWNIWCGIKFPKDVPVELSDKVKDKAQMELMLRKAAKEFWEIIPDGEPRRGPGRPPKVVTDGDNDIH